MLWPRSNWHGYFGAYWIAFNDESQLLGNGEANATTPEAIPGVNARALKAPRQTLVFSGSLSLISRLG
jgi:hypothetical protein